MKAKKSLMAVLWPLLKQNILKSTRYLKTGVRFVKSAPDKKRMNLKALEERIAESGKLVESSKQNAERLKQESRIPRIPPDAGNVVKYHDRDKSRGEGSEVQMSWREDEDEDRSSVQECFSMAAGVVWALLIGMRLSRRGHSLTSLAPHNDGVMGVCFERLSMAAGVVWSLLIGMRLSRRGGALATSAPHNDGVGEEVQNSAYRRFGILLLLLLMVGIYSGELKAQNPAGLQVGDQVPDVTISNLINYKTGTAKLSDFKGRLLILDFWSTSCPASVALLPQLVKLQKAFPDKLQIIAVGKENLATVKGVASAKALSGLAFMPADSHLAGMFPHELVPQLVWINAESKVLGITTDYDATDATVQKIINQEKVVFKDSKADQIGFDSEKPLFLEGNGRAPSYLFRSFLTPYSPGLPEGAGIKKDSSQIRLYSLNQGRLQLFFLALRLPQYSWPASRIIYEGVDVSKFTSANWVEDKYQKAYCYELTLPSYFEDRAHAIMLRDLQTLFGATAAIEKRTVPCYVLKALNEKLFPRTRGAKRGNNFQSSDTREKWMTNTQLVELIAYLQDIPGYLPVLDETGYQQPLDLKLNNNLKDISSLNKSLFRYGLQMQLAERSIEMLVISEIDIPAPLTLAK
jgi:thiol-disulfide isomerase/thioredoxin